MPSKYHRKTAAFALAAAIAFAGTVSSYSIRVTAVVSVGDKEKELDAINRQIDEYDKMLASMGGELDSLLEQKSRIDSEIEIITEKIVKTNELISLYDGEIDDTVGTISGLESDIEDKYVSFKNWLRMMQLYGSTNPLEVALSSDSFMDFLESVDRLGSMIKYQNDVMDDLKRDVSSLLLEKESLDSLRSEQLDVVNSLKSDSDRLTALRTESENYISTLRSDMDSYNQFRAEAQAKEDELNEEIEAQLREIAEREERERLAAESMAAESRRVAESIRIAESIAESERLAEESRNAAQNNIPGPEPSSGSGNTEPQTEPQTEPPLPPQPPVSSSVDLLWPIAERRLVTTTFLYERQGDVPHRGIDIPAPAGTAIRVAQSGTVITAKKHSSYGNYVIVSHGNGYATLYAHCTKIFVSEGDTVSRGDTIASVGNTGNSGGNHLHFEVRKNGQLTDPLGYYDYMKNEIIIDIYDP